MDKYVTLFKTWLETSSQKQKLTAALFVFSILCTLGLMALKGTAGPTGDPMDSTPFYFISVFAKLIVVLLLIVASSIIFRRWLQPGVVGKRDRQVQLLETVRLSPKQAVHLISVGGQQLLVGATDQNITLLTAVEVETGLLDTASTAPVSETGFSSVLESFNLRSLSTPSKN